MMNSILKFPIISSRVIFGALGFLLLCIFLLHGFNTVLLFPIILGIFLLMTYVFQIVVGDKIIGAFISLALLVLFSWIKSPLGVIIFYIFQTGCLGFLMINKNTAKSLIDKDFQMLSNISKWDAGVVFILLLHVMTMGWFYRDHFYMLDIFHPTYELSIGRSYAVSILQAPPDLSYLGKVITHHFLSTNLPVFLSDAFKIHILSSLYFIVPGMLLFIYLYLTYQFFEYYPDFRTPLSLIFLLPIMAVGGLSFETNYERFFQAPSFALAIILVLCSIYFIAKERFVLLILSSTMLLFTKAPFFMVIAGGMSLYWLRVKKIQQFVIYSVTLGIIFLVSWKFFYSHVKGYYIWIKQPFVFMCESWFAKIVLLYLLIAIFAFFKRGKENIHYLLSSLAITGIATGTLILNEVNGKNNIHFLTAAILPFVLIFYRWILDHVDQEKLGKIKLSPVFLTRIISLVIFLCFMAITVSQYRSVIRQTIKIVSERMIGKDYLEDRITSSKFKKKIMVPSVSKHFVDGYVWLKNNTPSDSVVLFGKHYEAIWSIFPWFVDSGHVRTALSARQMYHEGLWYKGIYLENDVFSRFAKSLYIYQYFVKSSAENTQKLNSLLLDNKWYWHDVPDIFVTFPQNDFQWAQAFLNENKIDYVVLEAGDLPTNQLASITEEVYNNGEVRILKNKINF